jgi:hypothetical protein
LISENEPTPWPPKGGTGESFFNKNLINYV